MASVPTYRTLVPFALVPFALVPFALVPFALVLGACGAPATPEVPSSSTATTASGAPSAVPVATPAVVASSASAPSPVPSSVPSASKPEVAFPKCGLAAPVVSEDTCKVDADCAPKSACHAKACVAKGHAEPPNPKAMCTKELRCDTADANTCGCVAGKCTLHHLDEPKGTSAN
ncbi:MAG: hypothetical protein U0169_02875 [Polyangiaceae bacterium]